MSRKVRILILEDDAADAEMIERRLNEIGTAFSCQRVHNREAFLLAIKDSPPDLVLADYTLPSFHGMEALLLCRQQIPDTPFVVVSGVIGEQNAVELLKQGAADFVSKKHLEKLVPAVQRALQEAEKKTAQRRAEASVRDNEARFRAVFEGARTGIAVEDLQGRILESNRALQQMLGYSAEELQDVTRRDFTHGPEDKHEKAQFERLLSGRSNHYQVEKRFVRKDGRIFWGQLTVSIVRDDSGKPQFPMVMIEDITERQRAEEAMLQYASIVESSHDAIISQTLDDVITGWNPAAERVYGYSMREANGHTASIIIPPDREEEFARVLERVKRGESVESFETTRTRKDGLVIHVSVSAAPIRDASGKIVGISTISRDVTERRAAEEALRHSEENYRKLVEFSPDAIFIHAKGKFVYVNSATLKLFGIQRRQQIIGKPFLSIIHPDFHKIVLDRTRQLSSGQAEVPLLEEKIVRPDGQVVDIEAIAIAFVYDGQPAIQVVARDITERKRADEALRRSQAENQKLAAFAQLNPNAVMELSSSGAVNYFNEAAQQMARSLERRHPAEILPAETSAIVRESLDTGRSRIRLLTSIQTRTLSWSFFPIASSGVVHCYATDITERQNLEAQLRQAQKMESVGQLAGGVAHDFNNILTVIQGHTSLLTMTKLPEEALDSAQQIAVAAERAANLTRQLLTFSRRQLIQPKNIDLNEVVNNMTKMLRRLLGEDITLQVNYARHLPLVHADPGMIEQIVMNLAVNARDAMPKGGRLFISTCTADFDAALAAQTPGAVPGQYVCICVKDTGNGIPPEILPHIFEPFFTTKDVGKGTGLGLATVYGIVQQHRGLIKVSSKLGSETLFQALFPALTDKAAPADSEDAEPEVRGGNETVLVVEDETPLRSLVRNVLKRYGYEVLEAASGVEALPVWLEHRDRISLLLTDVVMPHGVSGRELAERLRKDKPDLKVIYSSGYGHAIGDPDMVLREGLNFLQKPYHPRVLAKAVRDCLDA